MTRGHPVRKGASGYKKEGPFGQNQLLDCSSLKCGVETALVKDKPSLYSITNCKAFVVFRLCSSPLAVSLLYSGGVLRGSSSLSVGRARIRPHRRRSLEKRTPESYISTLKVGIYFKPVSSRKFQCFAKRIRRTPFRPLLNT